MQLAILAKEKSIEMAISEECTSMEVLAKEMTDRLSKICRVRGGASAQNPYDFLSHMASSGSCC